MAESESKFVESHPNRIIVDSKEKETDLSYQFYLANKRLIDVIGSVIGLILTLPVMVLTATAIKLESSGPIIFKQTRIGLQGEEFTIYKFRSMVANAEKQTGPVWAKEDDPRVTKVGEFIRKTRIDELPQFINILKGDMSLVGPRPERAVFVKEFTKEYPQFKNRLQVRPGVTGLAQVTGGYELSPHQKARLDLLYIENQGLLLDIKILLKTVLVVILGDGAR